MPGMTKEEFQDVVKTQVTEIQTVLNEGFQKELKTDIQEIIEKSVKTEVGAVTSKFKVDPENKQNPSGFLNFADFAQHVYKAGSGGQNISQRMLDYQKSYKEKVKAAGSPSMITTDGEAGGYLIPDEFRTELLSLAVDNTDIINRAMKIPMSTNSLHIPYVKGFDRSGGLVHGGVQFKWLAELEQKTSTQPKIGRVKLELNKCAGLCYVSDEMLEDSPISMEPFLKVAFTDALSFELDGVALNGSGAGQPLGMNNAPCIIAISKEVGQDADTILYENIVNMYARMWRNKNAVWMANKDTFPQLSTMVIPVGTGGIPVYIPANSAAGKPYDTLLGLPLIWCEHMKGIGDQGDIGLYDWTQYLVGNKASGLKFASSIHLKFDYDQTAFRFTYRIDGQPWWESAMTPRYSSSTLSPAVVIEART